MSKNKVILCLANSKKMSGRCVAGREVQGSNAGPWVRPVSTRVTEEVSEDERQYQDGSDPRILDVIDIPLIRYHPHACQTENWIIDPDYYWSKVRQVGWAELQGYIESPPTLWTNGRSTYNGVNDEILCAIADKLPNSLVLIKLPAIELRVLETGGAFGNPKRRVQARFDYSGNRYCLWVTDPVIERIYKAKSDGVYHVSECCLCISIGEPMLKNNGDSCRYKLVATIIQRVDTLP